MRSPVNEMDARRGAPFCFMELRRGICAETVRAGGCRRFGATDEVAAETVAALCCGRRKGWSGEWTNSNG